MRDATTPSWRREFAKSAAYRREQELFAKQVERRIKEDRRDERIDGDLDELAAVAVLASESDITEFRARLDAMDTANTEALIENERLRRIVQARIDQMLEDAYVLPDGRRVFKMKDGRVIDEHGAELGADEIDPDLIEDWRPIGEDYILALEDKNELDLEHQQRLDFQERIDEAREQIEGNDVTKQDIADIETELEASMPRAAGRTPGNEALALPDASRAFERASNPASAPIDLKLDLPEFGR
jgi:hypothetical protein